MFYKGILLQKTFPALFMLLTVAIGCFGSGSNNSKTISIGSKSFTEQYIVANIITLLLEDKGFRVNEKFGAGSMITRMGLLTGQIDLYPEYTGTAWLLYLSHKDKINNPERLFEYVKDEDLEKNRIMWIHKTEVNNTYALAIRKKDTKKFGSSLSSLSNYLYDTTVPVIFGVSHEFYERPDGFKEMAKVYGLKIEETNIKTMEIGLTFESISREQIDVAMVFSTDGKLKKYNLTLLEDDKRFFPQYNLCLSINEKVLIKYPEIKGILKPIVTHLNNNVMQELNYQVDVMGKPSKLVADNFLKDNNLLK
ncbi:MAG: glycine betaine ABC transporter substrate-binding protein [Spirochaetota bacterium]|nr:glycine betaine ABC transporter substrate-binding protein [Spirochaetota bacterium]